MIVCYNIGILLYQFYNHILLDSVYESRNYLNGENRPEIGNNMKNEAYLNTYLFVKYYRLYRMYCIFKLQEMFDICIVFDLYIAKINLNR